MTGIENMTLVFGTKKYQAYECAIGGMILRKIHGGDSLYFQPGDEAEVMRNVIADLDNVPHNMQDNMFNSQCDVYF